MESIQILYAARTGHSKMIAEAIGKELSVEAQNIEACSPAEETGLLFLVGGIYAGKSNPVLMSYAGKIDASHVKKIVLVTSSVSSSHRSQKDLQALLAEKGLNVVGEITCTGGFLFIKSAHPNKQDLDNVAEAAKDFLKETNV